MPLGPDGPEPGFPCRAEKSQPGPARRTLVWPDSFDKSMALSVLFKVQSPGRAMPGRPTLAATRRNTELTSVPSMAIETAPAISFSRPLKCSNVLPLSIDWFFSMEKHYLGDLIWFRWYNVI